MAGPLLSALVLGSLASADIEVEQRAFRSSNERYEFRLVSERRERDRHHYTWALVDVSTGATKYKVEGPFGFEEVSISSDGRSLAVFDSFAPGLPDSERVVLKLFRDGRETRAYSLRDLGIPPELTFVSVSHFQWFQPMDRSWPAPSAADTVRVRTYDLHVLTLDLTTATLLNVTSDQRDSADTLLIVGSPEVLPPVWQQLGHRQFQAYPTCVLRGRASKDMPIEFDLRPDASVNNVVEGYRATRLPLVDHIPYTLLIRGGQLVAAFEAYANGCDGRPRK